MDSSSRGKPMSVDRSGRRFGPIWLAPGVSLVNAWSFAIAAYTTIGLLTFVATATPYVLNANLGIPQSDQGQYTGDLQLLNEIILLLVFAPAGILADRIGRRGVYASGLLCMALAYILYPLSGSIFELTVYRAIYAVGIGLATGMLGTIVADYPQDISRGKMVALVGILNGLGVVTVTFTIAHLPGTLANMGLPPADAGRYAHWVAAAFCLLTAVIVARGLQPGAPIRREEKPSLKETVLAGITEARNPRIALAYACAFIARSDLVVLGTFTTLWGQTAGIEHGLDPARAAAKGAQIFGTASLAALLWLPIIGAIVDRMNRVSGVTLCLVIAVIGFVSTLLIDDPLKPAELGLFALLGIGQISAFLGATVLISAEAPRRTRGAVVGMFNVFGAVGIIVSVGVGGRLFDAIAPAAPFVFIGLLTVIVVLFAVIVRIKSPGRGPLTAAERADANSLH
ncbi:MAG: MFS transporter [Gammaproteobacteria bacterium]|nr:MAG: MFS transporter [Gammaproteobacteria bacterium]